MSDERLTPSREAAHPPTGVLVFRLNDQRLGLLESAIVEIVPSVALVPLADAPPLLEGLMNVRGEIVPVLDIRKRLKLAPKSIALSDHFIVTRVLGRRIALRVDRAEALLQLPFSALDTSLAPASGLVAGVLTLADGLLLIHDPARFLSEDEALEIDRALAGPRG